MAESNIKLVVEKRQFLSDLGHLNAVIREYQEYISGLAEQEDWQTKGLELARAHGERLNQAKVSLKTLELAEALLREILNNISIEQLTFKPVAPSRMGKVEVKAAPAEDDLKELIEQLQSLACHAPLSMQETTRFLLVSISGLFKALIDDDPDKIQESTAQINLLTSNRESQNLIKEIAFIAHDIYESLKSFTNDMPLNDLSESAAGISEAVRKLKSVISRLEQAANQNLDAIDVGTQRGKENGVAVNGVLHGLRGAQQKLGEIRVTHPEAGDELARIQDKLGDGIGARMMMLQNRIEGWGEEYLKMMANQSFQDLTGQTMGKIITFVEELEMHLVAILEKYRPVLGLTVRKAAPKPDEAPEETPARQNQGQVDALLADLGF